MFCYYFFFLFFFNDTATTEIYTNLNTLSLHDALPIYPLGYALGYFVYVDDMGNTTAAASEALNIVYNLADVVNKIAFGLLIWYAATSTSKASAPAAA